MLATSHLRRWKSSIAPSVLVGRLRLRQRLQLRRRPRLHLHRDRLQRHGRAQHRIRVPDARLNGLAIVAAGVNATPAARFFEHIKEGRFPIRPLGRRTESAALSSADHRGAHASPAFPSSDWVSPEAAKARRGISPMHVDYAED